MTFPGGRTTTFYIEIIIDNGKTFRTEKHLTDYWTERAVRHQVKRGSDIIVFFNTGSRYSGC